MLFKDYIFLLVFEMYCRGNGSVCNGYKVSLIVPAQFSKTNVFRCFRGLESIYHTQYLHVEDMIYYYAMCYKLVVPENSL